MTTARTRHKAQHVVVVLVVTIAAGGRQEEEEKEKEEAIERQQRQPVCSHAYSNGHSSCDTHSPHTERQ